MAVLNEDIAVTHPFHSYQFTVSDMAISQNDTALYRVAGSTSVHNDVQGVVMPWGGSIVGVGVTLSANKTAGTLTFYASIGGAVTTFGATVANATSSASAVQKHGITRFAAGAVLGVMYDSDANLLPAASADAAVDLYVVFDKVSA